MADKYQYDPTKKLSGTKFGDLGDFNWAYQWNLGDPNDLTDTYAATFSTNKGNFTFVPEEVVNKGFIVVGNNTQNFITSFLNPEFQKEFNNSAQAVDLKGLIDPEKWGWINNKRPSSLKDGIEGYGYGWSGKGYLVPETTFNNWSSQGFLNSKNYELGKSVGNVSTGAIKGMSMKDGQYVYVPEASGADNALAYIAPDGKTYANWVEKKGGIGGFVGDVIGGFGDLVNDLGPLAPLALNFIAPGAGTAFAVTNAAASGNIEGALTSYLLGNIASPVTAGISEAAGGGMLGSAIGQGATSAGLAALQGGDVEQAALLGTISGAANYTPPAQGMNSPLTPAQIESGLGTEGYGVGAQAQSSGLFDPAVIGSGSYTQTSYPIDMAEFAAADALKLMNQGVGIPAVEQNLISSGLDPLIAADLTQQISLDPNLTSNDLANNLISTYGSNIYDTTINQINEAAPKSTEPVPQVTSADINWGALAKGLVGLLGAGAASQMASQPAVQQQARPAYKPVDNMPTYSPEYFQQIQQYYNTYLPSTPRDVATPLQDWYSSGYEKPDSVTAKLFSGG